MLLFSSNVFSAVPLSTFKFLNSFCRPINFARISSFGSTAITSDFLSSNCLVKIPVPAPRIMHGKSDVVTVDMDCPIFDGIGVKTEVGRYHSLVIDEESLPNCLNITARSDDDCIMGVQHNERPVYGIQFHPESVLTPNGMKMIETYLSALSVNFFVLSTRITSYSYNSTNTAD